MPLRLAILEADTPVPAANARYQGYFGVFKHLFARAVSPQPLESVLTVTGHDVVHNPGSAYPSLDDIDAILITGSKYNAFDDDDWIITLVEYVRKALLHERVRVVGICFGHQIVARAMGTLVARSDQGWEVSVTETRLTEKGREVFGGRETLVSYSRWQVRGSRLRLRPEHPTDAPRPGLWRPRWRRAARVNRQVLEPRFHHPEPGDHRPGASRVH
jgi:GMP synthase-like glutamine amidotransferase